MVPGDGLERLGLGRNGGGGVWVLSWIVLAVF